MNRRPLRGADLCRRSPGQVMILFTFALPVLLLGLVLAVDVANIYLQRRVAQNAADAGALAGIRCLAVQWFYSDPAVSSGVPNDTKCREGGNGRNVWTEVARAVNCNRHVAPLTIEAVEYVGSDGNTVIATVTGTQNGCPATGGSAPTTTDADADGATNHPTASGIRVRVRGDVTPYFLQAVLAGVNSDPVPATQAGLTGPNGTYPVSAVAVAQIGIVTNVAQASFALPPFALCADSAHEWLPPPDDDPVEPYIEHDLVDDGGVVDATKVGLTFILVGQKANTCLSPTGQGFMGQVDQRGEGVGNSTGDYLKYKAGEVQSQTRNAFDRLCGSHSPGTECPAVLPLVDCDTTPSDKLCRIEAWATFKIRYVQGNEQARVSATLIAQSMPAAGGPTGSWTTFGGLTTQVYAIKLSG